MRNREAELGHKGSFTSGTMRCVRATRHFDAPQRIASGVNEP